MSLFNMSSNDKDSVAHENLVKPEAAESKINHGDESDDDPVIQEIDVFLAKSSEDELFVCQYPTRSFRRTFDNEHIVDAKIKPVQKKMEITVALETNKSSYDASRASNQFAATSKDTNSYFKNEFMDRQVYQTTQTTDASKNVFVGYLKNGQLHLSPASAILQLHSNFAYMDIDGDKNATSNVVNEEEQEAKPVTVKFAKAESDRARKAREKSYNYFLNKSNQEAWLPCKYLNFDNKNVDQRPLLGRSNAAIAHCSSSDEYSKTILSTVKEPVTDKKKTITEQLQILMINVKISHFADILRFLENCVDQLTVVRALQHVAVLINGCWIVKSEFLYPKNTASAITGTSFDLLCKVRDLVLWMFTQSTYVARESIILLIKIPDEDLKQMLTDIAIFEYQKGWKLSISNDELFEKRFPEVSQRQKLLWDAKHLSLKKDSEFNFKKSGENPQLQPPIKKRLNYSTESESEPLDNKKKFAAGNTIVKTEMDKADTSIDSMTDQIEAELSSFIKNHLANYKVITVLDLRRHLNKRLAQSVPGNILSRGVTDSLIEVTLKNLGAFRINSGWIPTPNEAIYALAKVGDEAENMRKHFLELFRDTSKLRKAAIKKGYQKVAGSPLSDDDLNLLTKDYCCPPEKGCYSIKFSNCR